MKVVKSIRCPECGNDLWTRDFDFGDNLDDREYFMECTNCLHRRSFTPRRAHTDYITPSQKKAIEKIKAYFETWQLHSTEISYELTDWGAVSVSVRTDPDRSMLIQKGGHLLVSRNGAITLCSVYDITENTESTRKHYAKMLGARLMKLGKRQRHA